MANLPLILLAAGSSSRMGQTKQLLPWGEETLIEHQIQTLLETGEPVIVVLGAHAEQIKPFVQKYAVTVAVNEAWESGMGSSISCGIRELDHLYPTAGAVLLSLVDQPLIPVTHFKKMLHAFSEGQGQIIASSSGEGWLGVPAMLDRCYFSELRSLSGEKGAQSLIRQYPRKIMALECPEITKDIDTRDAYQDLVLKHLY